MIFTFLIYVQRSGSTLLARHLAEQAADYVVLPECRLLEVLLAEGEAKVRRLEPPELARLMKLDHQLASLGVDDTVLTNITQAVQGQGIRAVLEAVATHYARLQGKTPNAVLIKQGSLFLADQTLAQHFPERRYIHVYRDIRGVANSNIHSRRPYFPDEVMGRGDVIYLARFWNDFMADVATLRSETPVLSVSYEDFCQNPSGTCAKIFSFVGVQQQARPAYTYRVADDEKSIHRLVTQAPQLGRLDAWQQELRWWQGIATEVITQDTLEALGYQPWFLERTSRGRVAVLFAYAFVRHVMLTARFYYQRFHYYRKHLPRLFNRLKLSLIRGRNSHRS